MLIQKGFASLWILVATILGVIALGGGAYYTKEQQPSPSLGALFTQGLNQNTVSIIALHPKTGARKEIVQIPNAAYPNIPKIVFDKGTVFYITPNNAISRYDMQTGHTSTVLQGLESRGQITDFAVHENTLTLLTRGSKNKQSPIPSYSCDLGTVDMTSGSEAKILTIETCEQPHGPNYSIQRISSDGSTLSLLATSGESGYESIAQHEVRLADKAITLKETFASSPLCNPNFRHSASSCTQEVQDENAKFDAFQRQNFLGYGWQTQCGGLSIKKDPQAYYTFHINSKETTHSIELSNYIGCF